MRVENEAGVIVYFAQHCKEIGYEIEAMNTGYPDAIVRRLSDNMRIRVEFEYESRSFYRHGHDPRMCDLIVCWKHTGLDTPIPIIELEKGTIVSVVKWATEDEKELQYYKDLVKQRIPHESSSPPEEQKVGMNEELMDKILSLIEEQPDIQKTTLAKKTGVSRMTVYRYLGLAKDLGLERVTSSDEQEKTIKEPPIHYDC